MKLQKLENLKRKKLFLFDIDGTLGVGDTLYPGTAALLQYIRDIGGKAYFITNNSTRSSADYAKKFRDVFGLETSEDLFITSGYMTIRFLTRNYPNRKIFVLGTASFIAELRKWGLLVTEKWEEDIACVVAAYDSELHYGKLIEICKVLSTLEVPFFATNPDLCCPIDFGFLPDCGSICEMITHSTGKIPQFLGKPNGEVVDICLQLSGFSKEETLVVGDRLYTDIACGINGGVDTCVVFTGEAKKEDLNDTPFSPDYAFATISELYQSCLSSSFPYASQNLAANAGDSPLAYK